MLAAPLIGYLLLSAWRRLGSVPRHELVSLPACFSWALIGVLPLTGFSAVLFPLAFVAFAMALFARRVDPRPAPLCVIAPAVVGVTWAEAVDVGRSWVFAFAAVAALGLAIAWAFATRWRRLAYARQYTGRP